MSDEQKEQGIKAQRAQNYRKKYEKLRNKKDHIGFATAMKQVQFELEEAEKVKTELQAEFDHLRYEEVPNLMSELDLRNFTVEGVGRMSLTPGMYASIIQKHEAYIWLKDNGHGDLIKETVNSGSLQAALKQAIVKGEELPDGVFKITPYTRASITKV